MSGVFVFLGPSLTHDAARAIYPDATYLPPASMGDVYDVLKLHPSTIAIIDGYFDQTPSVWHKEVLLALSRGVRVLGASSMGALRAAELHVFGMEGVGEVFRQFRDGVLNDDDEVAVVHGDASTDYRVLSEAMVNLRAGLQEAHAQGLLSGETREQLEKLAKTRFYPTRSWAALLADAQRAGVETREIEALRQFVKRGAPDVKRRDAVALLELLASGQARPAAVDFPLETSFVYPLLGDRDSGVLGLPTHPSVPGQRVTRPLVGEYVRTMMASPQGMVREALYLHLVIGELARMNAFDGVPARDYFESLLQRMVEEEGPAAKELLEREVTAQEQRLMAQWWRHIDRVLPLLLRRDGKLSEVVAQLEEGQRKLLAMGTKTPQTHYGLVEPERVRAWYAERTGLEEEKLGEYAASVGMTMSQFENALLRFYLLENARGSELPVP